MKMTEYLLGDVCSRLSSGKSIKSSQVFEKGRFPVFGGNGIRGYTDTFNFSGECAIVGRQGAYCGNVQFYKGCAYMTEHAVVVCGNQKSNTKFLGLVLQKMNLGRLSHQAAQPGLSVKILAAQKIKLPAIETQTKIAQILTAYDDLIETNQKQIKLLEEAAQRLYKEWFADLRFPGHEKTKIIEGIPEGWSYKPLSNIFDFIRGKSYTSKELSDTMGVLMVNLKNIRAFGGYKRNAEKRFTGQFKPTQNLTAGDLVMGVTDMTQERRLVGHVALVPDLGETMTFSMDLIKIIPKLTDKIFIYSALYYGGLSKQISPLANGVNVLHLKPEAMMGIEMLVPCDEIVRLYSQQVTPIFNRIEALQKQCDIAAEARDRLLPKLMSGEMEV